MSLYVSSRKECTQLCVYMCHHGKNGYTYVFICIITKGMYTPMSLSVLLQKECIHICANLYYHKRNVCIFVYICTHQCNIIHKKRDRHNNIYICDTKVISKLDFTFLIKGFSSINANQTKAERPWLITANILKEADDVINFQMQTNKPNWL